MNAQQSIPTIDPNGSGHPKVYLCQVGPGVSCGACCGLYNVADLDRAALEDRLARRSRRFAEIARTENEIDRFQWNTLGWTSEVRPFPQFHHCPFLGLIGQRRTRVGCLLHPEAPGNQGRDFRHLSYYGAQACATYFCPTYTALPARHLMILRNLFHDWYDYGLIITEHRLLKAVLALLERHLDRPLDPSDFVSRSAASDGLRDLLRLKLAWPHRSGDAPGPCHFPFDNGLYPRPEIDWPSQERPDPLYQTILLEMESHFPTTRDVVRAIARLDHRLAVMVNAMH